jgi:predicted secreted protein
MMKLLSLVAMLSMCHTINKVPGHIIQSDSILHVTQNRVFAIELRAGVAQGFSWQLKDSSKNLDFVEQIFKNANVDADGTDGIQQFYFRPKFTGKSKLTFIYVRPWEKPYPLTAITRTFIIITKN